MALGGFAVKLLALALSITLVAAVACTSGGADPDVESATTEALAGGCHQVCPHCSSRPGTECPLAPCYLQCSDPQGHAVCPENELCIQGYTWQPNACKCVR
jgi:hypothetical protein